MIIIKCIDGTKLESWQCNARQAECNAWLEENVGARWYKWDWTSSYGYVMMSDSEKATYFKLKFGV